MKTNMSWDTALTQVIQEHQLSPDVAGGAASRNQLIISELEAYRDLQETAAQLQATDTIPNRNAAIQMIEDYNNGPRGFNNRMFALKQSGNEDIAVSIQQLRHEMGKKVKGPGFVEQVFYNKDGTTNMLGMGGMAAGLVGAASFLWNKPIGLLQKVGLALVAALSGGALAQMLPWAKDKVMGAGEQEPDANSADMAQRDREHGTMLTSASLGNAHTPVSALAPDTLRDAQMAGQAAQGAVSSDETLTRTLRAGTTTNIAVPGRVVGVQVNYGGPIGQPLDTLPSVNNNINSHFSLYPNQFPRTSMVSNDGSYRGLENRYNTFFNDGRYGGVNHGVATMGLRPAPNMFDAIGANGTRFEPQYSFGTYVPNNAGMRDYNPGKGKDPRAFHGIIGHFNVNAPNPLNGGAYPGTITNQPGNANHGLPNGVVGAGAAPGQWRT